MKLSSKKKRNINYKNKTKRRYEQCAILKVELF